MRNRRRERGAAIVEAAVIAPIFAMFWLAMVHISGVYQYKIRSTQESRYAAFYRATNGCEKSGAGVFQDITTTDADRPPESFLKAGQQGVPPTPTDPKFTSPKGGLGGDNGDDSKNITSATAYGVWKYNQGAKVAFGGGNEFSVVAQSVSTTSQLVCNEPPQGVNVFGYLGNVAGQVGSAAKSFVSGKSGH